MELCQVKIPILNKIAKDIVYKHLIKIGREESYARDIMDSVAVEGAQKDELNKRIWITYRRKIKGEVKNASEDSPFSRNDMVYKNEDIAFGRIPQHHWMKTSIKEDPKYLSSETNVSFTEYMSYYREFKLNELI